MNCGMHCQMYSQIRAAFCLFASFHSRRSPNVSELYFAIWYELVRLRKWQNAVNILGSSSKIVELKYQFLEV